MNRTASLLTVLAGAALAGCAYPNTATYAAINPPPRAFVRRDAGSVELFVGKVPARPYVEVGMFEVFQGASNDGTGTSTEAMIGTLRLHAGLRGCDAVQVLGVELARGKYSNSRVVRGVCVMYSDAEAQQAASRLPPFTRLQGEGSTCTPPPESGATPGLTGCNDPLTCLKGVCVSPYQ